MNPNLKGYKIEDFNKFKDGFICVSGYFLIKDSMFFVFNERTPQMNQNKAVADSLAERLVPGSTVEYHELFLKPSWLGWE